MTSAHDERLADLHGSLADPAMHSMNFLNEIAERHPDAISFAAGRPTEEYFDLDLVHRYIDRFVDHLRVERGCTAQEARRVVLQYGPTKGIIADLVRAQLATDNGLDIPVESVVVTAGCQEGLFLVLRALAAGPQDVVLATSPTYVGLAGAARLLDMPVWPVRSGPEGVDLEDLTAQLAEARGQGLRPRALYVIPDSANPTGITMPTTTRRALLARAYDEGLLLLEDTAYSVFAGPQRQPSLKALDEQRTVVHLGSFAKTSVPGARVGYVVADQESPQEGLFADRLAVIKSMVTVNTSPIAQAVVGGSLLAHGMSLRARNRRETELYDRNRRLMTQGLTARFADRGDVRWNSPEGGFFLTLTVPFEANDEVLEYSAGKHGVVWTPMSYFYADGGGRNEIRLSYSQVTPEQIAQGLDRLEAVINHFC
jgi:(S)-3,5-dihydroxyphenylglycine transaminase